jgi:hypothetical protein
MICPKCKKRIKHLYSERTGRGDGGECDCEAWNDGYENGKQDAETKRKARDAKLRQLLLTIKDLQAEVFTETMRIIGDDFGETQCADSLTELQSAVDEALLVG